MFKFHDDFMFRSCFYLCLIRFTSLFHACFFISYFRFNLGLLCFIVNYFVILIGLDCNKPFDR